MNTNDKINVKKQDSTYHKSVLVNEVVTYLNPQPNKLYIDATFGGGGHTRAILRHEPNCRVIGLDWDQEAIDKNLPLLQEEFGDRVKVLWGNFAHINRLLKIEKIKSIDGVIADFGTSQFQIFEKAGFSFMKKTPLDMRMSIAHQRIRASDILNRYDEKRLAKIFFEYGEERHSRAIARAIVEQRKSSRFLYTNKLSELIEKLAPSSKKRGIHPATRVFQALRIEVNHELENIQNFLSASLQLLKPEGRLVCISFHSLEDRIVKNFFKINKDSLTILTKKPVTPTEDEIKNNPSSRSAKLRAAEIYKKTIKIS